VVWKKSIGLKWKRSLFTGVITVAPSTSLAHSSASALPREFALLGAVEVVGLSELAVVIWETLGLIFSHVSVGLEVIFVKHLGVIKFKESKSLLSLLGNWLSWLSWGGGSDITRQFSWELGSIFELLLSADSSDE